MAALKGRLSGAEQAADLKEDPIASLFKHGGKFEEVSPEPAHSSTVFSAPQSPAAFTGTSRIMDIPADALDEMEQPFRRYSEKKMEQMRDSIIRRGIIHRIIVRPNPEKPGRYQIISGRHRRRGAMQAGYTMIPCEIIDVDDDEARLKMLSANLEQREELLPSEKAWAYREQMELLSRQGKRTDIEKLQNGPDALGENGNATCGSFFHKLRDELAADTEVTGRTIQKYIRLTYLMPELLEAVDDKSLGFEAGVTLSYLSTENQEAVYDYFFVTNKITITGALADMLRISDEKGVALTAERLDMILAPAAPFKKFRKVSVPMKQLRSYFPAEATAKQVEKRIVEIVKKYFEEGGQ